MRRSMIWSRWRWWYEENEENREEGIRGNGGF